MNTCSHGNTALSSGFRRRTFRRTRYHRLTLTLKFRIELAITTKNPRLSTGVSCSSPWQCPTLAWRMPNYHRRWCVSLPSSGWDRVGPHRYGRQGIGAMRARMRAISMGSGCDERLSLCLGLDMRRGGEASWGYMVKPHGSLVRVSSMHCCTSTPRLSTRWSTWVLQGACAPGDLILVRASRLDAFSGYRFRT